MSRAKESAAPRTIVTRYRGGPLDGEVSEEYHGGLTIREHFAGLALQGLCANPEFANKIVANMAVEQADALLTELSKQAQP